MSQTKRLFVFGPFGTGNVAADWTLEVLRDSLSACDITLGAADPQQTAARHGAAVVPITDLPAVEAALRNADAALWVGGELPDIAPTQVASCVDLVSGRGEPELAVGHLARLCGRPLGAIGVSVGLSAFGLRAQPGWQRLFEACGFVGTRDLASRETLRAVLGGREPPVYQADLRFISDNVVAAADEAPRLAVVWREDAAAPQATAAACDSWLAAHGDTGRVALCATRGGAAAGLEAIRGAGSRPDRVVVMGAANGAEELRRCIAGATTALAMDGSAFIVAWQQGVPLAPIAADNEAGDLLTRAGAVGFITAGEATPDVLARMVSQPGHVVTPGADFLADEHARAQALLEQLERFLAGDRPRREPTLERSLPPQQTLWRTIPVDPDTGRLLRELRAAEARVKAMENKVAEARVFELRLHKAHVRADEASAQVAAANARAEAAQTVAFELENQARAAREELEALKRAFEAVTSRRAYRFANALSALARLVLGRRR